MLKLMETVWRIKSTFYFKAIRKLEFTGSIPEVHWKYSDISTIEL
jgi:hypothetical protein